METFNMTISVMIDLETWGTEPGCDIRSIGATVFDPLTGDVSIPCQTCKGGTTRGNVNDGGDCSDCMNTRMERGYGSTFYQATENPRGFWGYGIRTNIFNRTDKPTDRLKYHALHRDPQTVQWWSEQSEAAQGAFADPMDLHWALVRFRDWLIEMVYPGGIHDTGQIDVYDALSKTDCLRLWSHGAATDTVWLAAAYRACKLPVPWHHRAPRDTRTIFDAAGIDDHSAWLAQTPGPLGIPHHALEDAICQARAVCAAFDVLRTQREVYDAQAVVPPAPER